MKLENYPMVSIQIPTYEQKDFIIDAVESATMQTYQNLQIIVSDDCSKSYDIKQHLARYKDDPRVSVIRNDNNLGRVGNYHHTLFNHVRGEWFINLDGDDFFTDQHFIEDAVPYLEDGVAAYQAGANLHLIKQKLPGLRILDDTRALIDSDSYLANIYDTPFTHASVIFNTELSKKADFYNIDVLNSDYFSFLKIISLGRVILDGRQVYQWRHHADQASHTISFSSVLDMYSALDDLKHFYKVHHAPRSSAIAYKDYRTHVDVLLLQSMIREGVTLERIRQLAKKICITDRHLVFLSNFIKRRCNL